VSLTYPVNFTGEKVPLILEAGKSLAGGPGKYGTMAPPLIRDDSPHRFIIRRGLNMARRHSRLVVSLLLLAVLGGGLVWEAEAASKVTLVNQTGYFLDQVKYVQEKGDARKLVGTASRLSQNGSHTFKVNNAGSYRCFISFQKDGRTVYAKGNVYQLDNNSNYKLYLQKVVFKEGGSAISFINQGEFDAVK
jgi:hypothetical protein